MHDVLARQALVLGRHGGGDEGNRPKNRNQSSRDRHIARDQQGQARDVWPASLSWRFMPPGTPYHSFVLPYRIRVDSFATPPGQDIRPALHLLTHTHSDHINGLSAKTFGHRVICSHDAKEMLLRHEVYDERQLKQNNLRAESVRTFAHLKVDPVARQAYYQGSRDLLVTYLAALLELDSLFVENYSSTLSHRV